MKFLMLMVFCVSLAANSLQPHNFTINVQVTRSEPVYQTVVDRLPYEQCAEERVPIKKQEDTNIMGGLIGGAIGRNVGKGHGRDAAIIGGTVAGSGNTDSKGVFGGIVGGVLGKQVGKGRGKDAAMVVGAILGQKLATEKKETGDYLLQTRCTTKFREVPRQVLVGYNSFGSLLGQEISKFATIELKEIPVTLQAAY